MTLILLGILISIVAIILIILYLGVRIIADWKKVGSKLEFKLTVLFLSKINVYSIEYPSEKTQEKSKEENKNFDIKVILKALKPTVKPLLKFLKKVLKSIEVEKLKNHINLGMDSYVSTAKYIGYLWSIFIIPNSLFKNANLTAEPNFDESIFDFNGECDIKINLLKIAVPAVILIKNKNIRKLIKVLRGGEKDGTAQ